MSFSIGALPKAILGIETVYGKSFDVTRLTRYLQEHGRRFLELAALVFYETMAQHVSSEEQPLFYAVLARQFGVDILTPAGSLVADEEAHARLMSFLRHRIALGMRHRDGRRLTETEIRSILDPKENTRFSQAWEKYWQDAPAGARVSTRSPHLSNDRFLQRSFRSVADSPVRV